MPEPMGTEADEYLLAGRPAEEDRLLLQARVWESAGRDLLTEIGSGTGLRAADIGCGALGWLRLLSEWVGPSGRVTGTDIDGTLLTAARGVLGAGAGVSLVHDDLFASGLGSRSFDVVHARFLFAPLGRFVEQLAAHRRLVADGGLLVIEEPDSGSWHVNPPGTAVERLIGLIREAFRAAGGDLDAGRSVPGLLREAGLVPQVRTAVLALKPGHPYLRLPLQFSASLEPRLAQLVGPDELRELRAGAEAELARPGCWGTTFTLVQTWTRC